MCAYTLYIYIYYIYTYIMRVYDLYHHSCAWQLLKAYVLKENYTYMKQKPVYTYGKRPTCMYVYIFTYVYNIHIRIRIEIYNISALSLLCVSTASGIHIKWWVGSFKLYVSLAKEPYYRDYIMQKRPIILSILLTVATP